MAREFQDFEEAREYGKLGGNPNLKDLESIVQNPKARIQKLEAKGGLTGIDIPPLNPTLKGQDECFDLLLDSDTVLAKLKYEDWLKLKQLYGKADFKSVVLDRIATASNSQMQDKINPYSYLKKALSDSDLQNTGEQQTVKPATDPLILDYSKQLYSSIKRGEAVANIYRKIQDNLGQGKLVIIKRKVEMWLNNPDIAAKEAI